MPDRAEVRAELARILASECFLCCEPQARLLRSAVEKSLEGRRLHIKPEPAAQLRARLAEYYAGAGASDPVLIELPDNGSPAVFLRAAPLPPRHTGRRIWAGLALLLAATILLVWAGAWWRALAVSAAVRSLAVLPFVDRTSEAPEDWLAPSLTGEVIDDLARVPGMQVIARTSAFHALPDPGRQLGVAAVLTGVIRRTGKQVHVEMQMTRTSDGYDLWSTTFDRPGNDLRTVEKAIAAAIAKRLQLRLPATAPRAHQPSERAYEAYLEGRYFFQQRTLEALNHAAERLEEATRVDPDFARAWAWLSIVREYRVAAAMARPNQGMPGSRDAAERAAALDPGLGDGHLALGIVKLQYDWDWAAAKAEFDRAWNASPESAFVLEWRARWFESQGRANEAITELSRALALDPLSVTLLDAAATQYVALNQPDKALPLAQKAVDASPGDPAAKAKLAAVLLAAGEKDKSRQVVDQLRSSPAAAKLPPAVLPALSARLGDPADARQLLDAAEDLPDDELLPALDYARLAGSIQDWDRMFSWAEEAYDERDVELPYWRACSAIPKSDARFDAFLSEMNLAAAPSR